MMTETQALNAANLLRDNGMHEAAEEMDRKALTLRAQHFHDMQARCMDDPDFALAYERDRMEERYGY